MKPLAFASLAVILAFSPQAPAAATPPPPIPAARDLPYIGPIDLEVDATDVRRGIFSVVENIPARPGPMVLLIPKWQQGAHSIQLPVANIAGITITANGKPVSWRRDPADVYAFHVDVPAGASSVTLSFKYLSPTAPNQGRIVMSPVTAALDWSSLVLYPAGYYASRIVINPRIKLPAGWTSATSLTPRVAREAEVAYPPTDLDTLIDSPVVAGANSDLIPLGAHGDMFVVWDQLTAGKVGEDRAAQYQSLMTQAEALFGRPNYSRYRFLIKATDGDGLMLEHRRSALLRTTIADLAAKPELDTRFDLMPHEFVHSWNGKSRRPSDLWQPEFSTPQRGSLLWVYEGLTQYWGVVLGARSGFGTPQTARDYLAYIVDHQLNTAGRGWRNLQDTTTDNTAPVRKPNPWNSYRRWQDFYYEGVPLWLEVDQIIQTTTGGQKSLDDFAKAFFPLAEAEGPIKTYVFEDLTRTLNGVAPYDWDEFFKARLTDLAPDFQQGLRRSGYQLAYKDERSALMAAYDAQGSERNLNASIGATISEGGEVTEVIWGGPAYDAGLTVGAQLKSINGKPFKTDGLIAAIVEAATGDGRIAITFTSQGFIQDGAIDWRGGLRFPHLVRNDQPPLLDRILAPH